MFDLLPKEALPRVMPLPSDLAAAVEDCVTRLKTVPQSSRRDSALNALGRIKQPSLKEKIRHRSRLLVDVIGERIPSIDLATDASVDLRNFYVHGTPLTGRKKKLPDFQIFLTNTLEFVFCGSDLVELGWDIGSWCREYKGHPFGIYLYTYQNELSKLMRQLE